ncbi:ProQ/FINO family protein [Alkalilimnicola sp. S0819]|uniref:ProQ/FINO family protein n=1 Tax=Alkalilimnicola sp. S0819 TaxID=2613922 RepID=UPI001261B1D1|nr:ProQ/FINO family protein [Alkalilimnicola sp. S0819]KAB7619652.1 prop expression regulator [Alkalilimnicola sp. S0819]MPQ17590.1 prop expression regulator [Alkalilimnicola sp. S0819]
MSQSDTQKRKRAERTREFLGQLAERYPQTFTRDRAALRPLAIGIQKELRAALDADEALKDTPNWLIRQALALYTRSMSYREAIIEGRPRIDLQGEAAGEISDADKQHAQSELDKQKELRAARQAERQAERKAQQRKARQEKPSRGKREPRPSRPRHNAGGARPAADTGPAGEPTLSKLEQLAAKFNQR